MSFQVILIPNQDSTHFLLPIPDLLNNAQRAFSFRLHEHLVGKPQLGDSRIAEVDNTLLQIYSLKGRLGLKDEDLVIQFINKTLVFRSHGLTNLFVAGSNLDESPPRVATISTEFIHRHILPADPMYLTQRHAFYHLMVCCLAGAFLDMQAHEDRGCLLDFNSYRPNFMHKIEVGYSFCDICAPVVEQHPLGAAIFKICGALKVMDLTPSRPHTYKRENRLRVFLCYAGSDRSRVLELYERLDLDGFEPWMDKKNLIGGQDWRLEIQRAISSSNYFIACLSRNFQSRTYGHKEIKLALDVLDTMPEGSIYLIPVRLEESPIEDRLAGRQWIDLFETDGYDSLVRALRWKATAGI